MDACRICYEPGELISVCQCDGTTRYVHLHCIQKWLQISKRHSCEICHGPFSHEQLVFPKTDMQHRLESFCFIAGILGGLHGVTIWLDAYYGADAIWINAMSSVMFNASQIILTTLLKGSIVEYWKIHVSFFVGFVIGNVPGHIALPALNSQSIYSYIFNLFFLIIFLGVEYFTSVLDLN